MSAHVPSTASLTPVKPDAGKRSLISRLTSPLRSRTRNLTDFHIRPADPHRHYSPGDLVRGAVVLTVVKPIRITHLTVCLHGFVRVFKHHGNGNDAPSAEAGLPVGFDPRKTQYFGNGHASLFQDEVTLCGEGRLEAGIYEFNFELEFPRKGLPTSIDFERGTISYMISSTITRPTSIAATSTCDQKLSLIETVDIGPLNTPKPRVISLEPISRRTRRVKTIKSKDHTKENKTLDGKEGCNGSETTAETDSPRPDDSASQCDSAGPGTSRSTVQSDINSNISTSHTSSTASSQSFRIAAASAKSVKESPQSGSNVPASDKTITATIELLKAGVLPGETLPLMISIKHTKAIKSMHGIIITLYRQGRIDSAPPLSLFVDIKGKEAERLKHEEYYPKSKTGLSGLSLSSAGSSSLFRKDLAQTFAPILIDPTTLRSVVNASVRVPEDVFPTISGVPGQMISFKYYVEVVVDLGGRLAGQERHLPRVGTLTANTASRPDGNPNVLSAWGGSIVDTDHIRREKSVVTCHFEVVVGTTDSERNRLRGNSIQKRKESESSPHTPIVPTHEPIYEDTALSTNGHQNQGQQPYPYYDENYHEYFDQSYDQHYDANYDPNYHYDYHPDHPPPAHSDIPVPPPEIQAEELLTEKDRVRRAEERLLPSQPPQEGESSSSNVAAASSGATAPSVAPEDDIYSVSDATPRLAATVTRSISHHSAMTPLDTPSAPPLPPITPVPSNQPSAPTESVVAAANDQSGPSIDAPLGSNHVANDDKQELERKRLLAEASAPDVPDDNSGEGSSSQPSAPPLSMEPSAPVFDEADDYGGAFAHHTISHVPSRSGHDESLPKYER